MFQYVYWNLSFGITECWISVSSVFLRRSLIHLFIWLLCMIRDVSVCVLKSVVWNCWVLDFSMFSLCKERLEKETPIPPDQRCVFSIQQCCEQIKKKWDCLDDHVMYTVICFHDSHNPSRGWWSPCLADTCICELCHRLLGLCTFRLPLNLQLLTVPSESCVFSRNQRHSFIHTWSILFMFELNITIMWVELLCKINIQHIPSSTREAFYLCLNWTSPSCEWNCCARSTYNILLHPHVKHFIYVWTEHHHHVSGTVVQDQHTRYSFIHTWSILFMFELNITIMWVELLCKIKVQDQSMRYHCEIETVGLRSRLLSRGWNSWSKVTIIAVLFSFVLFLSTSWSLVGN